VGHDGWKGFLSACRKQPAISDGLLDQLLDGRRQLAFDPNGMLNTLKKALAERMLNAEMDQHLGGEPPTDGPTAATATARRRC